jgi:hypothetical protein
LRHDVSIENDCSAFCGQRFIADLHLDAAINNNAQIYSVAVSPYVNYTKLDVNQILNLTLLAVLTQGRTSAIRSTADLSY